MIDPRPLPATTPLADLRLKKLRNCSIVLALLNPFNFFVLIGYIQYKLGSVQAKYFFLPAVATAWWAGVVLLIISACKKMSRSQLSPAIAMTIIGGFFNACGIVAVIWNDKDNEAKGAGDVRVHADEVITFASNIFIDIALLVLTFILRERMAPPPEFPAYTSPQFFSGSTISLSRTMSRDSL